MSLASVGHCPMYSPDFLFSIYILYTNIYFRIASPCLYNPLLIRRNAKQVRRQQSADIVSIDTTREKEILCLLETKEMWRLNKYISRRAFSTRSPPIGVDCFPADCFACAAGRSVFVLGGVLIRRPASWNSSFSCSTRTCSSLPVCLYYSSGKICMKGEENKTWMGSIMHSWVTHVRKGLFFPISTLSDVLCFPRNGL